jgi:putative sterol carrier protein
MTKSLDEMLGVLSAQSEPRGLPTLNGLVRIDVHDGERVEHRYLRLERGVVTPVDGGDEADCIISGERETLEAVITGRANVMAALLRGALRVEGRIMLLVALQRLFPAREHLGERAPAGYARRRS